MLDITSRAEVDSQITFGDNQLPESNPDETSIIDHTYNALPDNEESDG